MDYDNNLDSDIEFLDDHDLRALKKILSKIVKNIDNINERVSEIELKTAIN